MDIASISNPTPLPRIVSSVCRDRPVSLVCDDGVGDGAVLVIETVTA